VAKRKRSAVGYLLAVDTSSDILGVGLLPRELPGEPGSPDTEVTHEGHTESDAVSTIEVDAGLHHVERVMPVVEDLMAIAGVSTTELLGLVAAKGPGSFTGLRIGVSLLKGVSAVGGAPLVLVPTLEAHAAPYREEQGLVCAALDARKQRFYVQFFRNGEYLTPALDLTPGQIAERAASLLLEGERLILAGPDAEKLQGAQQIPAAYLPAVRRRSAVRGLLVEGNRRLLAGERLPDDGGPLYLRGSEAVFPGRRS
jgi:tRNA threonylcarbamoyladenosine biosynthesis protein TsaB